MTTDAGMLAPYRVLDLTDGRADLAGFILAGLGADVIKVEPPRGVSSRGEAPLDPMQPDGLGGLRFQAFNRGKRSVVLDLDADRDRFLALAATADFVIENAGPGVMSGRGLGYDNVRAAKPDVVYVAISPFGQTGPYAHHAATDLTLSAMGGSMALNGDPDRRPVRITVPQTWLHAAAESVVGALAAHALRVATGEAQFVDVSVQAAVFWTGLNAMTAHAIQGSDIERNGTALQLATFVTPLVYPCADGEVCLVPTGSTLLPMLPWMVEAGVLTQAWVDAEEWRSYEARVVTGGELVHSMDDVRAAITEFTRRHTKQELFDGGIARGITLAPVKTAADVLEFEQLVVRDYWDETVLASGHSVRAAGPFVKATRTPIGWARPAPALGEHTDEVLASLVDVADDPASVVADREPGDAEVGPGEASSSAEAENASAVGVSPRSVRRRLPFEGVKVADFSWIGVGPITAKALADHGATVIRVETDNPPDRLRLVGPFQDGVPGVNRCQFFGSFNTSKLSLQLNLKRPTGQAIARRLLGWADIALDSFTAGTMRGLGLGYDVARELNPAIIMATTCLLGQTGPAAQLAGYGYHAAAISGFYEITGWDDRAPAGPFNAYTDTIAPRFLAATLMAALDHRRRTGEGQFIDQAQMESALHFLGPELLDAQVSGVSARRAGNDSPDASPHDAYPCAGHDEWCAIAVETDDQWLGLRRALGDPAWAATPELATLGGRRAARSTVDAALARFTAQHDPRVLMDLLQSEGVPAGMVQRSSDLIDDPQLDHRRFFRPLEHPEMGVVRYEGHQYTIDGYNNGPRLPAPCLGEHTYEVLSEHLGMSDDEVADALGSGACG